MYNNRTQSSAEYFEIGADPSSISAVNAIVIFGLVAGIAVCSYPILIGLSYRATLILFQNIVPISLVITVELVKTIQAFFIYQDVDMYYEPVSSVSTFLLWGRGPDSIETSSTTLACPRPGISPTTWVRLSTSFPTRRAL